MARRFAGTAYRLLLTFLVMSLTDFVAPLAADETVGPWDLATLKQAPEFRWLDQTGPVHSLLYAGERFDGHSTEVFAYYATPQTLGHASGETSFPGVVLIHGGGGTAFAEWVHLWAERGYAAIAMDLSGSRPPRYTVDSQTGKIDARNAYPQKNRSRLPNGGPFHGHTEKFDSIGGDTDDDWPYHAVASVTRGHSLLRSFPEVQADNTAVTGISWGGYTTCLVASVDDRYQAAVPVYGCGFLYEGESVQKPAIDRLAQRRQQWIEQYDPSAYLPRCRVPILFVNGTNDVHYPLDSYQKSYAAVPGVKQMRIEVKMRHGHQPGWAPEEIGLFIDSYCRDGTPLPKPGPITRTADGIRLTYQSAVPLKSSMLHFSVDSGPRAKRNWSSLPGTIDKKSVSFDFPPEGTNTWLISLTDTRNAMVSTPIQFEPTTQP